MHTGYIRENFMRWLANDAEAASDNGDLGFPSSCAKDYAAMDNDQKGIGLVDQNMQNIDGMLQTVASYLTLQLIE